MGILKSYLMISDATSPKTHRPRYIEVAAQLRTQIESGQLQPGQRLPSFVHMRAQGNSQSTMDRVYALLEAEGIIERTSGSGIYVAQPKPAIVTKTGVIGLPYQTNSYMQSPYGAPILDGIHEVAHQAGYDIMLATDFAPERLAKMDGVLWMSPASDLPRRFLPATMPWVSMLWARKNIPSLVVDEQPGICAAVRHLWQLGHRRIAYLVGSWRENEHERQKMYRDSLRAVGIEPDSRWVRVVVREDEFDRAQGFLGHGYLAMRRWLAEDWKELGCTAILAHNDEAALGMLRAFREVGLHVPRDVSLIGFDGTSAATQADPPLTTVEVPLREIGAQGTRILLSLIENNQVRQGSNLQVLPVHLRIGESTAKPGI